MTDAIFQQLIAGLVAISPGEYAPIRVGNLLYNFLRQDVLQRRPALIKRFITCKRIKQNLAEHGVTISTTADGKIKLERQCLL